MVSDSKFYDFDPIEADDELEAELARLYAKHREVAKNKSEIELHNYLQDRASINKKEYHDVVCALLYGVLTEPKQATTLFQSISFVNRDHFATIIAKLQALTINIKFQSLKLAVREQIFWLISELTNLGVSNIDVLYLCLLRQIRGGDVSQPNLILCDQFIKLCERQKSWLYTNMRIIPTLVYIYLRAISDHKSSQLQLLQQKEIKFVITIMREKWEACCDIGRDLVRVLHDLSLTIPEFTKFWDDLLNNPKSLYVKFNGIEELLKTPTKKEYLRCRLTPDIEFKLLFILQNLRSSQYQRNLNWFIQRFLSTPKSEPFYVDVVRYLVAGWYPSNQILQSDIVPRYVIIGSMLRSIKNKTIVANVKMALIYDWLFFTPTDNIMFIEPAMLLMERSAERYAHITSVIMEYLRQSVDEYFPPLRDYMASCVACGMKVLLSKGVIRSLMPVYKCPSTDPATRDNMLALFSEFLSDDPSAQALPIPSMPANLQTAPSMPGTPKTDGGYLTEEEQGEGGERRQVEEDDVDEYLYGESDTNAKTPKTVDDEDEDMDEPSSSNVDAPIPEVDMETGDEIKEKYATPKSVSGGEDTEVNEQIMTDNDFEDEPDPTENMQSNQSYWIFGDSLKRFKEASAAAIASQKEGDGEQYATHLQTSKKSLKEILAVFLRMAIPAETLIPTIGSYVRNMIVSNLLTHRTSLSVAKDDSAVVEDSAKDLFDLIMVTFWSVRDVNASRDKLIRLIGGIAHTTKHKGRRHIVGMRWWSYIAALLIDDESLETPTADEWFPPLLANYKTYVSHAYEAEKSSADESDFFKNYLQQDLQMLAEQNVSFFNCIVPLLYQHLPDVTVDNSQLLRLTVSMLLPDALDKMICGIHFGSIKLYEGSVDVEFVGKSLSFPTFETMCFWQLLAAELQGDANRIGSFFDNSQIRATLRSNFKTGIMASLFSILTSTKPTKELLDSIFSVIPANYKITQPQVQFALASLQYWASSSSKVLITSISQLSSNLIRQIESGDEKQIAVAKSMISVITTWYRQALFPDSFKKDKNLLQTLSKVADSLNYECPKEWQQDPRKKKRAILLDSDSDEE